MKWIKRIIGFIRLYQDYEYEPETWRHIVQTYEQVLCIRTKTMSKPTYFIHDVLNELDEWYEYHVESCRECKAEVIDEFLDLLTDEISETEHMIETDKIPGDTYGLTSNEICGCIERAKEKLKEQK